jgi:hypothetical protein
MLRFDEFSGVQGLLALHLLDAAVQAFDLLRRRSVAVVGLLLLVVNLVLQLLQLSEQDFVRRRLFVPAEEPHGDHDWLDCFVWKQRRKNVKFVDNTAGEIYLDRFWDDTARMIRIAS